MSVVHLQQVEILNSSAAFADPYIFKITFECISELSEDIEWRLIYVGSAEDEKYDQELDNCLVGPVPVGVNSFEFEAAAPSPAKIPAEDLLGVTVILLTGSYREQEFIRVGYYVNNEYETLELRENPPEKVDLTKVKREVLVSKPRVTRFNIKWDNPAAATAGEPLAGEITQDADGNEVPTSGFGGAAASVSKGQTPAEALGKTAAATTSAAAAHPEQQDAEEDEAAAAGAAASSFKPVSVSS